MLESKRGTLALLLAVALFLLCDCFATSAQQEPILVHVYKTHGAVTYTVDSRRADLTPSGNLLRLLATASEKRGRHAPVVVLLDPSAPIEQIDYIEGVAAKVPLNDLHYFEASRQTGKMAEINFGPTIPYSTNPPLGHDPLGKR